MAKSTTTKSAAEVRAANAAVMAKLRNPQVGAAPTKTAAPRAKVKATKTVEPETTARVVTSEAELEAALNSLLGHKPSKWMQFAGTVCAAVTAFTSAYWGAIIANTIALAVFNLTGFAFLSWLVYFLLVIISFVAAVAAAVEVGTYVGSGKAKADVQRAKNWITSVFKRGQAAAHAHATAEVA